MYRQRKRDLNLKPNRQLDKRSSRGMIYENEELRMRTIAICEDVDRGQNDIKKLRKENDHLKREIWGLRDECEKLEEMLKRVCISANIPEIQLEASSSKSRDEGDEDDEDDDDDDDDERYPRGRGRGRKRRESGMSVMTYDSEVGSDMSSMFEDEQEDGRSDDIAFAMDDACSVLNQPGAVCSDTDVITTEAIVEQSSRSVSFYHQPSWGHAAIPPDLEDVREETDSNIISALNSPGTIAPVGGHPLARGVSLEQSQDTFDVLPDPNMVAIPGTSSQLTDGMKHPMIHITPASSLTTNAEIQSPEIPITSSSLPDPSVQVSSADNNVHSIGCITVIPKTFKVTSEILVGEDQRDDLDPIKKPLVSDQPGSDLGAALALANSAARSPWGGIVIQSRSVELPRKSRMPRKQDSDPVIPTSHFKSGDISSDQITINQNGGMTGLNCHRRSCYLPTPSYPSTIHKSLGVLGCCCSDLLGGCQSEPSLNSPSASGGFTSVEDDHSASFLNSFCCRLPLTPVAPPAIALRSVWNTVDRNIVIGFYERDGGGDGGEPKVQEIIDELEAQFDPTLENISGIRLIPGRIFISLKSALLVKAFLVHFKHDFVLRKRLRIHFIEGAAKWSTLVLSGIPQELNDLAVISALNQFGQVVAPLERRNYKGVDISERIAKMHLVISETSVPEYVSVSGYNVRIRVENEHPPEVPNAPDTNKLLKHGQTPGDGPAVTGNKPNSVPNTQQQQHPSVKYGFVTPAAQLANTSGSKQIPTGASATSTTGASSTLKPHKPVIRSSSSAPRLETPAPGTQLSLPAIEAKRQSSVCAGNISADQHPLKLLDGNKVANDPTASLQHQQKVTIAPVGQGQQQTSSTPNLQTPLKKPLTRLVSSPGSFQSSPVNSPGSPSENPVMFGQKVDSPPGATSGGGGALKAFCRSFDPRRGSGQANRGTPTDRHAQLTPSSSYSPKSRRKSSVQFVGIGRGGKKEPLPWCGCWGLGCG